MGYVFVEDAFVVNVMLKLYEGTAKTLMSIMKKSMLKTFTSKIGALLIQKTLKEEFKLFDATEHGGAPLLGCKKLIMKVHGNTKGKEISKAIFQSREFALKDINQKYNVILNKEK